MRWSRKKPPPSLLQVDMLIIDELGYLPFSPSGGTLLFHLLSRLYERASVRSSETDKSGNL